MKKLKEFLQRNNLQIYIVILGMMIVLQLINYDRLADMVNGFMNVGDRFTAENGIALCKRIAILERAFDIPSQPCNF